MPKITVLKGLPASGKSTWSKEQIKKNSNTKRVNKDDLRAMLDNSKWTPTNEKFILKIRDLIIKEALSSGNNVIVDDTNLHDKHIARIKELAKETNSKVEINDSFLKVGLEECIKRDLVRPNSVGEKVIRDMYKKFIATQELPIIQNKDNPKAVIFDVDGTLAIMNNRSPFDWAKVGDDILNKEVFNLYLAYKTLGYKIIICTGRDGVCEKETKQWLHKNDISYNEFRIRPKDNTEKDAIIKARFLEELVKDYYIEVVVDDRDQVVQMWRSKGLKCFQVAEGNF